MSGQQGSWKASGTFGDGWDADVVDAIGASLQVNNGTIDVAAIPAGDILGNKGTASAVPGPIAVAEGLTITAGGTLGINVRSGVIAAGNLLIGTTDGRFDLDPPTAGAGIIITTGDGFVSIGAQWNGGTVDHLGANLSLIGGTLDSTGLASLVGGAGISIAGGNTIAADSQGTLTLAGTVTGTITPALGTASMLVNVGTAAGTISVGAGLYNGQHLRVEVLQGATPHPVALDATCAFGTDITTFTASNTANARDLLQFVWNGLKWMVAAVNHGF